MLLVVSLLLFACLYCRFLLDFKMKGLPLPAIEAYYKPTVRNCDYGIGIDSKVMEQNRSQPMHIWPNNNMAL